MKRHNTIHREGFVRNDFDYLRDIPEDVATEASTFLFSSLETASAQAGKPLAADDLQRVRITITIQEVDSDARQT